METNAVSLTTYGGRSSGIAVVEGAFDPETIEKLYLLLMDATDADLGAPGKTMGGIMPETKDTLDLHLPPAGTWEGDWSPEAMLELGYDLYGLDRSVCDGVTRVLTAYAEEYGCTFPAQVQDTGYQFQRYKANQGKYVPHTDGSFTARKNRILALVIYLNDVEEGGETNFPLHGVKTAARAGTTAVFPTTFLHLHEGRVPVSEDKCIISTFIIDPELPDT